MVARGDAAAQRHADAAPRRGDLWLARQLGVRARRLARCGITALDVAARFDDDAVDATAALRSARGVNADATLAIGAVAGRPAGRIAPDAPLHARGHGRTRDLAAAAAVGRHHGGRRRRARASSSPARGTVGPAHAVRDAQRRAACASTRRQYGLHFTDGRLRRDARRRRAACSTSSSLAGGSRPRSGHRARSPSSDANAAADGAPAQIAGRPSSFRVFNRPDLRLVVDRRRHAGDRRTGGLRSTGKLTRRRRALRLRRPPRRRPSATTSSSRAGRRARTTRHAHGRHPARARPRARSRREADASPAKDSRPACAASSCVTNGAGRTLRRQRLDQRGQRGTYYAFGQRLVIDRGRLIFDGPLDNPGTRHRRAAQEPRRRSRRRGDAARSRSRSSSSRRTRRCPTTRSSRGWCSARASTAPPAPTSPRCRPPPPRCSAAPASRSRDDRRRASGIDDISFKSATGTRARQRRRDPRRAGTGRRRRQAAHRQALARLRAGTHRRDQRAAPRVQPHPHADAARRGRRDQRRRHLLPAHVRVGKPPRRSRASARHLCGDSSGVVPTCAWARACRRASAARSRPVRRRRTDAAPRAARAPIRRRTRRRRSSPGSRTGAARRTTYQRRISGRPTTSSSTRRPACDFQADRVPRQKARAPFPP